MVLSFNLFAYCENNPVNSLDPSGYVCINLSEIKSSGLWVPFCDIGGRYNVGRGTNYDSVSFSSPIKGHRFLWITWSTYYQVTYYMGIKTCKQWFDFCLHRFGWELKMRRFLFLASDSTATQLFGRYVDLAANVLSLLLGKMPREMRYIMNKISNYRNSPNTVIQITMSSHLSSYSSAWRIGWIGLETRYAWK